VRGEQHELEPIRDFVDAIFDGDAGHGADILFVWRNLSLK
jgi:hypothetical protein